MARLIAILTLCASLLPLPAFAETTLWMAEEKGCMWCARWHKEIGPIYPKTAEGKAVPLKRFDLHSDDPEIDFARRVHFTPTFILVKDGVELDRIEGYPGEDFFWGLLKMMLERAEIPVESTG